MVKGNVNEVLIHVPEDKKYFKKRSQFVIDTTYDPAQHVQGIGEVVGVPKKFYGHEHENLHQELEIGDIVLFHHNVIADDDQPGLPPDNPSFIGNFDGKDVYRCPYFNVYAKKKNQEDPWTMIGGWVLCDEYFEGRIETFEYIDPLSKVKNSIRVEVAESGLIAQANPGRSTRIAKLVNIGKPCKGYPTLDVAPGDLVVFRPGMDSWVEIQGKIYLIMRQEELYAKL